MEAIIFAAGLGTRLMPLTADRPKALVEVGGHTLLDLALRRVADAGASHTVVNIHHHSEMLKHYIAERCKGYDITLSDESPLLLDTGGALRKIARDGLLRSEGPYLIYNVDVLSHFALRPLFDNLAGTDAIARLAVSRRPTSRQLLFAPDGSLCGWHNRQSGQYRWSAAERPDAIELAYSGIAAITKTMLDLLAAHEDDVFPLTPAMLHLAATHRIDHHLHDAAEWLDVGKPDTLPLAESFLHKSTTYI